MSLWNYLKKWYYADKLLRLKRMQMFEEAKGNDTPSLDSAIRDTQKKLEELK